MFDIFTPILSFKLHKHLHRNYLGILCKFYKVLGSIPGGKDEDQNNEEGKYIHGRRSVYL